MSLPVFTLRPKAVSTPKLRAKVAFPGHVAATTGIKVDKIAGTWTFELDYTDFGPLPGSIDLSLVTVLAYDPIQGTFYVSALTSLAVIGAGSTRIITSSVDVAAALTDGVIAFKQTVPATVNLFLPAAVDRNRLPLSVEDIAGTAGDHPITIVPDGTDTIDGLTSYQIANPYGFATLRPYGDRWKIISP